MRTEPMNSHLYGTFSSSSSASLASMIFFLLLLSGLLVRLAAQTSAADGRIQTLQNSLRAAEEQHASPEQMGTLWHLLGLRYQSGFHFDEAEDAYAHAIHLLRNTTRKAEYGDSLHGAAQIYMMESRLKEARNNLVQARAVFEELGSTRNIAMVRCSIAMAMLREHKFREAETEASAALGLLASMANPDRVDLENAYITRARALAGEGRAQAGLEDVARARAIATGNPAANEVDAIMTLLVQGEVQMEMGLETEGEQSMAEALQRVRSMTNLPGVIHASLEASVLEREAASLRKAHHNQDAKALEDQMKQAQSNARGRCSGCTVSVTSLLSR